MINIIIPEKTFTISWFMIHQETYPSGQICMSVCFVSAVSESGSKSVVSYFWAPLTCRRTLCTAVRVVQYCNPHPIFPPTIALHAVISHPALYFKPSVGGPLPLQWTPLLPVWARTRASVHTHTQTWSKGNPLDVLWPHWNSALIIYWPSGGGTC